MPNYRIRAPKFTCLPFQAVGILEALQWVRDNQLSSAAHKEWLQVRDEKTGTWSFAQPEAPASNRPRPVWKGVR